MKYFTSISGFSLIEMSVSVALSAAGVLLIAQGLSGVIKTEKLTTEKREADMELVRALGDMLKVGRIAQVCTREEEPILLTPDPLDVQAYLECRVDRNVPPTSDSADDEIYRFGMGGCVVENAKLVCQFHWLRKLGTEFKAFATYDGITGFEICDEERMRYPGPTVTSPDDKKKCQIPQKSLSTRHLANVDAATFSTPSNRFFRFSLSADSTEGFNKAQQSAFFVRHPTASGFLYQWGQKWNE